MQLPWRYHPAVLKIWKTNPDIICPEDYLAASNEWVVIDFIMSWSLTLAFNPQLIHNNALADRLGYNNICIAWDEPPALYPAAVVFSFALVCRIRYCSLDSLRGYLGEGTQSQKKLTSIANHFMAGSFCMFPLVFVITPDRDAIAHSCAFVCLIFGNLLGLSMNFYEMDNRYHPTGSWVYLGLLTAFAVGFPICVLVGLLSYDEAVGYSEPVPIGVAALFDYGWFALIAVQSKFTPYAPSIHCTCRLIWDPLRGTWSPPSVSGNDPESNSCIGSTDAGSADAGSKKVGQKYEFPNGVKTVDLERSSSGLFGSIVNYRSSTLLIWRSAPEVVTPKDYLFASNEIVLFVVLLSWLLMLAFDLPHVSNNPLLDRLGYVSWRDAWNSSPGLFVAAVCFTCAIQLRIRYCYLDNIRCRASDSTEERKWWISFANLCQALGYCVVPLIFVITPDRDPMGHSLALVPLVWGNLVGMFTKLYETDGKYHPKRSWTYFGALAICAICFPVFIVVQLLTYDEEAGARGDFPAWLTAILDYGWFVLVGVQPMFLPHAPSLQFTYKLVEDTDFQFFQEEPALAASPASDPPLQLGKVAWS